MNQYEYESELEDLKAQVQAEKRYHARLSRNPDCRDPDHPGCSSCMEDDDEE